LANRKCSVNVNEIHKYMNGWVVPSIYLSREIQILTCPPSQVSQWFFLSEVPSSRLSRGERRGEQKGKEKREGN
jgi:hypothetical protein